MAPLTETDTASPLPEAYNILTKQQVCEHLQLSPRALEMAVRRNQFPPAVRVGKRVFWSRKAVDAFIREQFRQQEAWQASF